MPTLGSNPKSNVKASCGGGGGGELFCHIYNVLLYCKSANLWPVAVLVFL
jgi:hypothetical protein